MIKDQAKLAIDFLRSRQEYYDLRYWLALVSYDPEERTVSNQFYLLYLIIFFTIWFFMVLIFAAKGVLRFFQLASPMPAITIVSTLLLLSFVIFAVFVFFSSSLRSPLIFTEEHRYLLCQQPVPSRYLVFRWLPAPWLQSLVVLILICLMLGFSLGEITFPADDIASYFLVYVWYGLRVALLAIPYHFALFTSTWAVGLYALRHRGKFKAYLPMLVLVLAVLVLLVIFILFAFFGLNPTISEPVVAVLNNLLLSFFGQGKYSLGFSLMFGVILSAISLLLLWLTAKDFSPAKAAHETQTAALLSSFVKYGQFEAIELVRRKRRMGLTGKSRFLPDWQNSKAFAWKMILQARRTLRFSDFYLLLVTFLLTFGFQLMGNTPAGWLGLASWVWMLSRHLLDYFKQDLSLWPLTRQVPIPTRSWALIDLLLPTIPHLIILMISLCLSFAIFPVRNWVFLLLLPIGLLGAILQLGQDILRKTQIEFLAMGTVQSFGFRGLLMAILCLLTPLLILWFSPGFLGLISSVLSSALLFWISYTGLESQLKRLQLGQESLLF